MATAHMGAAQGCSTAGQGFFPDPEPASRSSGGISGDHLARGMMLLRASNMSVMRLQLAMQREDRRLAMAAMDDLVGLDRELSTFVASIPATTPAELARLSGKLDAQKQAVVEDRLVLARGKTGPALAPVPAFAAEQPAEPPPAAPAPVLEAYRYEASVPWWPKMLFALLVMTVAALGIAYGLGLLDPYVALVQTQIPEGLIP